MKKHAHATRGDVGFWQLTSEFLILKLLSQQINNPQILISDQQLKIQVNRCYDSKDRPLYMILPTVDLQQKNIVLNTTYGKARTPFPIDLTFEGVWEEIL